LYAQTGLPVFRLEVFIRGEQPSPVKQLVIEHHLDPLNQGFANIEKFETAEYAPLAACDGSA